jgi:hypothetical protein
MPTKIKYWDDLTIDEKIARWEHVDKVLENLSPHERRKHFNLGDWGSKTECGTVACVAGHCGLDPEFRRQGFRLDFEFHKLSEGELSFYEPDDPAHKLGGLWVMVGDLSNDAYQFFGDTGYRRIFLGVDVNGTSVGECRKAIKRYLRDLEQDKKDQLEEAGAGEFA